MMKFNQLLWVTLFSIVIILGGWHDLSESTAISDAIQQRAKLKHDFKFQIKNNSQTTDKTKIVSSSSNMLENKITLNQFERNIAQRLMISIRYFCDDESYQGNYCQQPVTKLPAKLAELIKETEIGGVVLFAENIISHQQTIELTNDLQLAASQSNGKKPLFIGIDQEGGRVVRLPREISTAFSGNMAIAATYPKHNDHYAKLVAEIIGQELFALGINLNFAPNVDVNSNPDNPVINARSFGEQPLVVSKLGIAMLNSFQQQNVIATLKHFPGHGNTDTDSHTGLPRVDDDEQTLYRTDLLPFQEAIDQANPGMIMTAHIQYPNLDQSTITTKLGQEIIKPATMSYKLLTELLRRKMGFKGVVITDAMNMAGISHHFDLIEATTVSLAAGADIVLMPYRISKTEDIEGFKQFVRSVSNSLLQQGHSMKSVLDSVKRIDQLKKKYRISETKQTMSNPHSIVNKVENANLLLARDSSRNIQNQLVFDSVTLLKTTPKKTLLSSRHSSSNLHIVVQDNQQLTVVNQAIDYYWPMVNRKRPKLTYTDLSEYKKEKTENQINQADSVILFYSARRESAVVKGEIDDLPSNALAFEQSESERLSNIYSSLKFAQQQNKKIFVAGMYSPYEMKQFMAIADTVLVAYDANIYEDKQSKKLIGMTYNAVIAVLLGIEQAKGILPVTL